METSIATSLTGPRHQPALLLVGQGFPVGHEGALPGLEELPPSLSQN